MCSSVSTAATTRYDPERNNQFGGARHITDLVSLEDAQQFVRELNGEPSNVPEEERDLYIQQATEEYALPSDNNIEIYETADVRKNSEGGVWVEAYVYLYPEESDDET